MGVRCPSLPPELVDNIIDHLHDDIRALCSASLVARSWVPSTRYHLFSCPRICKDWLEDRFVGILKTPYNTIARVMRGLKLVKFGSSETIISSLYDAGVKLSGLELPFIGSTLERTRRRTLFTISNSFPNLTRLVLGNVYTQSNQSILEFICSFQHLEVLSLSYADGDTIYLLPNIHLSKHLRVLVLRTCRATQSLGLFQSLFHPEHRGLNTLALYISFPSHEVEPIQDFLLSQSKTLEHLALHFCEDLTIDLGCLSGLRSLHLTLPYDLYLKEHSMITLCGTIESIQSPHLHEISICTLNDPAIIPWSCLGDCLSKTRPYDLHTLNFLWLGNDRFMLQPILQGLRDKMMDINTIANRPSESLKYPWLMGVYNGNSSGILDS